MKDVREYIEWLKSQKDKHLGDIERLERVVKSIDNIIKEYMDLTDKDRDQRGRHLDASPKRTVEVELADLDLYQAIVQIMESEPDKEWQGIEISRELERRGYPKLSNQYQRVAARLISKSRLPFGKIRRIDVQGKHPRYRLREKEAQDAIDDT